MYYPSSENKGADQLHGYREADLRLCFRICRLLVFSRGGSFSEDLSERLALKITLNQYVSIDSVSNDPDRFPFWKALHHKENNKLQ